MTEEWFTIENVEESLRRVFGDRSRKEISMLTTKMRPVTINVTKKFTGKKRSKDESAEQPSRECFYCFEGGHWKKDCPVMAEDRDPKRPGGKLFRSNFRATPLAMKKRLMTVKKGAKLTTEKVLSNQDEDRTPAEAAAFDSQLEKAIQEADELE
ncbi:RNA binding protein [Phytophthora palmivora]|uniref:RNA binding protein n=1 Tax=Phytophthora palmivora TaxID=4796 RepID=A0A2P4XFT3_9STRA|nr:RNA binding protein [Phytophthora palmivora]